MIAAGSLFTSCVENTEPQGIRDLREAKADYLASLSKLREADAEKVKAEAAVEQAKAEVQKAIAAQNQALAEAQKIANEAASIANEEAAARAKAAIDTIKAKAALDAVKAQEALAKAQADLDKALRKIAAEAIGLTGAEKQAIWEKTYALNIAYASYNNWLCAYNAAAEELWKAEYDVVAGVKGYETADSYRDSIAVQNDLIAKANEKIASLEALKEHPQAVKDTLDAIDAQIAELTKQIALIVDEKILYEATPGFVAAKAEFAKRVETFKDDSLKAAAFVFADEDEDGNDVPVEYALTDGNGVDEKLIKYINNYFWLSSDRYSEDRSNYFTEIKGAEDAIEVYSDNPKWLEMDVASLEEIVESLNRELVVIDNLQDSIDIEDAKKAAHVADSIFDNHYDILKKGLAEYDPYKDSVEIQNSLKLDTAAAHKAYAVALNAYNTVKEDSTKKDNARILAVRDADDAYTKAKTALNTAITTYEATTTKKTADSTAYIAAFNAFGAAQAAFCGKQDSLICKQFDSETGGLKPYKEALSEISLAKFQKGKYIQTATADAPLVTFDDLKVSSVISPLDTLTNRTVADSIAAVKHVAAVAEAIKAFDDFKKEDVAAAKHDADSTANDVTKAETALTNYKGVTKATIAYRTIYKSFWGITGNLDEETKKTCDNPYPFTWTKATFLEPENCVEFYIGTEQICDNVALWVALNGVDVKEGEKNYGIEIVTDEKGKKHYTLLRDVNESKIFKNGDKLTEFAQAILKAQIVEELGEYVSNKARLAKINEQVAQIRADVEAAIAEYEAATEGQEEILARLCGVDEDGNPLFSIAELDYLYLEESRVEEGKWAFGGYLLEWAEELAPEYPEIVKDVQGKTPVLFGEIAILTNYRNTLDWIFTGYYDFFEDPDHAGWNVEGIIAALNGAIKYQKETVIAGIEIKIAEFEKLVAACEAGYSPAVEKIAPLKQTVDLLKKYLEQAEEALARAQKEYDEVIAQYGVKE